VRRALPTPVLLGASSEMSAPTTRSIAAAMTEILTPERAPAVRAVASTVAERSTTATRIAQRSVGAADTKMKVALMKSKTNPKRGRQRSSVRSLGRSVALPCGQRLDSRLRTSLWTGDADVVSGSRQVDLITGDGLAQLLR